ncbi:hypothetical protein G6F32_013867 [Rhizopus arrhizus]|nr:hypothetical protein G6F32_013867 [Rhizopus arrhizus]
MRGGGDDRHRPLQAHQRHLRPRSRRRCAARGSRRGGRARAQPGPDRALRWRGVLPAGAGHGTGRGAAVLRGTAPAHRRAGSLAGRLALHPQQPGRHAQRRRARLPEPGAHGAGPAVGRRAAQARRTQAGTATRRLDTHLCPPGADPLPARLHRRASGRRAGDHAVYPLSGHHAAQRRRVAHGRPRFRRLLAVVSGQARPVQSPRGPGPRRPAALPDGALASLAGRGRLGLARTLARGLAGGSGDDACRRPRRPGAGTDPPHPGRGMAR